MSKSKKQAEPESIALTFDLHDLPTAQHRAGLAGLMLQIKSMGPSANRRDPKLIPIIDKASLTASRVTITFTRDSMQGVFDDLYAAKPADLKLPSPKVKKDKQKNNTQIPWDAIEVIIDSKGNEQKRYVYKSGAVIPQSPCLTSHLDRDASQGWLNLWRRMLWSIPRGGKKTRAPFNDRACGQPCGEGVKAWSQLVDHQRKETLSRFATATISGALMLGVQAKNAELVPFEGRVDHNLLLHFWQLVVMTFTPMLVNRKEKKIEQVGYVLAIPDVANLIEFERDFPRILAALPDSATGRTPTQARLDLPEQAGLEVLRYLKGDAEARQPADAEPSTARPRKSARPSPTSTDLAARSRAVRDLAAAQASRGLDTSLSVRAVETYHMLKQGNNVKLLSFSRLAGRDGLVEEYEKVHRLFRNPLFRAARMRSLIRDESWHLSMAELFGQYPWSFFIPTEDSPRYFAKFGRDAREHLRSFEEDKPDVPISDMTDEEKIKYLSLLLRRLMTRYVDGRAASKLGLKIDKIPKKIVDGKSRLAPTDPDRFREAQQRVCSDAYLAMRSKHDQDFVEFFAGSVCSVGQYLALEDYQFLTTILLTNPDRSNPVGPKRLCWEDVKTIAMFAVSAHAFNVRDRTPSPQGSSV